MPRIAVITGAASGIGKATKDLLESRGERVIGVDLHDADIEADLTTTAGRTQLVEQAHERSGGVVDSVYAVAGLSTPTPTTAAINFFGATATLQGLRPLLTEAAAPRAVAVSSMAALFPPDDELVAAMEAEDESAALERAEHLAQDPETTGGLIYGSSKLALSKWVRRQAPTPPWAGAGIALNAVAPGVIATPMTAELTATEESTAALLEQVPMPLNGVAGPEAVANLLAWLGSEDNAHLCGQIIYQDGGSDAVIRGDTVW